MNKSKEELFLELKTGYQQITDLLASVADDQDWRSGPKEWSFREVAAHMATVDKECFLDRVKRIASGGHPHFDYYLNTDRDFSRLDLRASLQQWSVHRQAIIDFVDNLAAENLSLTGTHVSFGTINLLDILQIIVDHDQEHLQELQATLPPSIPPARGEESPSP